jgi:GT2 family glycosyltransferase
MSEAPAFPKAVDLSIVLVSTDEAHHLARCLASVYGEPHPFAIELLVVDNASTDGTAELLREHYPQAVVLRTAKRRGYIENNNLAIARARGRFVLSMNADVVLEPGTLDVMVDFMDRHPDAAVASCRLVFEDGNLQLTCRQFPTPLTYLFRLPHFLGWVPGLRRFAENRQVRDYLMLDFDHRTTRPVDWMISAFFLLRRSVVGEIGAFAGYLRQPFYLEDVDWCFRARLAGYKAYYVGEVAAVHLYRQGSVRRLNRLSFVHLANILIFFRQHGWALVRGRHRHKYKETGR